MSGVVESRVYTGENIWKGEKGIGEGKRRKEGEEGNKEGMESNGEHRNRKIGVRESYEYEHPLDCCCLISSQFHPSVLIHYFHTCQK
jgi:hypothetical protein